MQAEFSIGVPGREQEKEFADALIVLLPKQPIKGWYQALIVDQLYIDEP